MKAVLALITLLVSQFVYANPEGEINYRQAVMDSVGGHMSAMAAILRNRVYGDNLLFHARGVADLADIVPQVFPEGSGDGKTEALPKIWAQPEDFKLRMDNFVKAAKDMAQAAETGEMRQIGRAVDNLGKSCKGCHDNYKKPHDHDH